jgi:Na+/melibiose symporter-like transporter
MGRIRSYAWNSPEIIALSLFGVIGLGEFVWWEHRAKEPILPLRLFRNSIFTVSSILSLIVGVAMFASIIYLPVYMQIVRGDSATTSGFSMLPLVFGIVGASILSGRLVSKTGRYKIFPILGSIATGIGLWLMTHIAVDTPFWLLSIWMVIAGLGIGLFLQVMTIAVQNATHYRDLGTATAAVNFFRTIGSSFGTAILGALLSSRVSAHIRGFDAWRSRSF